MKNNQNELSASLLEELNNGTKRQALRGTVGEKILQAYIEGRWDGGLGGLLELWAATANSRKVTVSRQGRPDVFVKVRLASGRVDYQPAEVKLNGGRISSLRKPGAPKWVIYALALDNSTGSCLVYPKLVRTADFLEALDELKATKSTNGLNPEEAVQPSKRGLWRWLEEQEDFNPEEVYEG